MSFLRMKSNKTFFASVATVAVTSIVIASAILGANFNKFISGQVAGVTTTREFNRTSAALTGTWGTDSDAVTPSFGNGYYLHVNGSAVAPTSSGAEWFSMNVGSTDAYLFNDGSSVAIGAINGISEMYLSVSNPGANDITLNGTIYCSYYKIDSTSYANAIGSTLPFSFQIKHGESSTIQADSTYLSTLPSSRYFVIAMNATGTTGDTLLVTSSKLVFSCNSSDAINPTGFSRTELIGDVYYHHIETVADFQNIISYTGYGQGISSTVYLIDNDIDFGGVSPWKDLTTEIKNYVFTGTIEGGKYASGLTYAGIAPTSIATLSNLSSSWYVENLSKDVFGLFDTIGSAKFNSLNLNAFALNNVDGKGCGFLAAGFESTFAVGVAQTIEVEMNYITIDDQSSISTSANTGGLLGYARGAKKIVINHCVNNAQIYCALNNVGGFIGTMSNCKAIEFMMSDSTNNGTIMGLNFVGGFVGEAANYNTMPDEGQPSSAAQNYSFTNLTNNGVITATNSDASITMYIGAICSSLHVITISDVFTASGTVAYSNCATTAKLYVRSNVNLATVTSYGKVPYELNSPTAALSLVNAASGYTKANFQTDWLVTY